MKSKERNRRMAWTQRDVTEHGPENWPSHAARMRAEGFDRECATEPAVGVGGRTTWTHTSMKGVPLSAEEEALVVRLHSIHHNIWTLIASKVEARQVQYFWRNRTHRQLSKICHSSPARSPAQTFPPTSLPTPSTCHSSSRSTTQTLTLTALPSPSACHSPAHSKSQTLPLTSLPPPLACPLTSSFHSPNITLYFSPLPLYVPPTSSSFHSTNPSAFFCSLYTLVNKLKEDNKLLSAERDAAKVESEDMANALKAEKDKVAFLEKKMYELLEQILALMNCLRSS